MRRERREHAGGSGAAAEWQGVTGDGGAERGGEGGWDDGVSAEHDVLWSRSGVPGASTRWRRVTWARRNARRAAGLGAAAARLEGARPGHPELGPG